MTNGLAITLFQYEPEQIVEAINKLPESMSRDILNLLQIEDFDRSLQDERLPYFQDTRLNEQNSPLKGSL